MSREEDKETRLQVGVLRERCVGAGQCVLTAPAVFGQDDEGMVRLIQAEPGPGQHAAVRAAAGYCPSRAIAVTGNGAPG